MRMTEKDYAGKCGSDCWNNDHIWRQTVKSIAPAKVRTIDFSVLTGLYCDVNVITTNNTYKQVRVFG
jgi:hypothetical protein